VRRKSKPKKGILLAAIRGARTTIKIAYEWADLHRLFRQSLISHYHKLPNILQLAWQNKTRKIEETGTLSKNSKYERRMLKIEGDIPFRKRSNLKTSVNAVNFESINWNWFPSFFIKLCILTKCYILFRVIIFLCLSDEFQFSRCKQ